MSPPVYRCVFPFQDSSAPVKVRRRPSQNSPMRTVAPLVGRQSRACGVRKVAPMARKASRKIRMEIDPADVKGPTIHGLRGTGVLTRFARRATTPSKSQTTSQCRAGWLTTTCALRIRWRPADGRKRLCAGHAGVDGTGPMALYRATGRFANLRSGLVKLPKKLLYLNGLGGG